MNPNQPELQTLRRLLVMALQDTRLLILLKVWSTLPKRKRQMLLRIVKLLRKD